ncbi:hypothetical protein ACFL2K_01380 [Candidatus Margulisiibacteriota bacterium]
MKKILFLIVLLCSFIANSIWATVAYRLEDFEKGGSRLNIGVIVINQKSYFKAGLSPDMKFGPFGLGFDLNMYIPTNSDDTVPTELSTFAFRMISYEHNDLWGVKWGRLTNVNFGYGLLMENYDSGSAGSTEFTTEKAGFDIYYNPQPIKVRAMWTATNLKALRGTYTLSENVFLGRPLFLGVTYVTDSDGVFHSNSTTDNIRAAQTGISADLSVPLLEKRILSAYLEVANLYEQGTGSAIGIGGYLGGSLNYRLEYRMLGKKFVPGYFNNTYEVNDRAANAFNFATDAPNTETKGWLGYIGLSFFDDYFKTEWMLEDYDNTAPILSAAVGWSKFGPSVGVINYSKSFQNPDGGIVSASILYENMVRIPMPTDFIFNIRRVYSNMSDFNDPNNYTESVTMTFRPNLRGIFPFLM